jgi:hypothetical protein
MFTCCCNVYSQQPASCSCPVAHCICPCPPGAPFPALQVALPEDPPWWELFNVQPSLMFEVCREMHQLYARPQAQYIPVYRSMLASKPPTPASPSGHQRLPEGSTGERLGAGGAHNTAGTPAFTPQAAADLERPSSQVDLLLVRLWGVQHGLHGTSASTLHVMWHRSLRAECSVVRCHAFGHMSGCLHASEDTLCSRLLDEDMTTSLSTQNTHVVLYSYTDSRRAVLMISLCTTGTTS